MLLGTDSSLARHFGLGTKLASWEKNWQNSARRPVPWPGPGPCRLSLCVSMFEFAARSAATSREGRETEQPKCAEAVHTAEQLFEPIDRVRALGG